MDEQLPSVIDRAPGAHRGVEPAAGASVRTAGTTGTRPAGAPPTPDPSDPTPDPSDPTRDPTPHPTAAPTADRARPFVRVDEARIGAPTPRPHLSPAQALDLVRRSSDGSDPDPPPTTGSDRASG